MRVDMRGVKSVMGRMQRIRGLIIDYPEAYRGGGWGRGLGELGWELIGVLRGMAFWGAWEVGVCCFTV